MRWLQAVGCNTYTAEGEQRLTTENFISELFYRVAEAMTDMPKHPVANLWPSEIVPVGILFGFVANFRWGRTKLSLLVIYTAKV